MASINPALPDLILHSWKNVWSGPNGEFCAAQPVIEHEFVEKIWMSSPGDKSTTICRSAHTSTIITLDLTEEDDFKTGRIPSCLIAREDTIQTVRIGVVLHPWIQDEETLKVLETRLRAIPLMNVYQEQGISVPAPESVLSQLGSLTRRRPDNCVIDLVDALNFSPTRSSLAEMIARSAQSPRTLRRKLKYYTGFSPDIFRIVKRIEFARRLIGYGRGHLADIACDLGFSDQAHMTRQFTELCGHTPEQWRLYMQKWRFLGTTTPRQGLSDWFNRVIVDGEKLPQGTP